MGGHTGGDTGSSLLGRLGSRAGREGEGVAVSAPGGQAEGERVQEAGDGCCPTARTG